jgi:hypothetical protein
MTDCAMNSVRVALATIALLLCSGCNTEVNCGDVIGTFRANSGAYRDIIEVGSDGTYVHTFHVDPQGPELVSRGKWTCEGVRVGTRITFEEFMWGTDFGPRDLTREQRQMPGFWIGDVEKSAGRVEIVIDPDVHELYVKE